MTGNLLDRRHGHTRIVFQERVRLFPPGDSEGLPARADNLSERGIFISSPPAFSEGTPLDCELVLSPDHGPVRLRGQVAWVRGDELSGMGVAFDAVDQVDLSALREAIEKGVPLSWDRSAKIWFAGSAHPTRARVIRNGDGLLLSSDLSFLRLGSQVVLSFGEEEETCYTGPLEAVSLHTCRESDIPRLEVSIGTLQPLPDPGETWTYWPPPSVVTRPPTVEASPASTTAEAEVPLQGGPPASVDDGPAIDDSDEIRVEEADIESADELAGAARPISFAAVSGHITARDLPSPSVDRKPSVETDSELLVLHEDSYSMDPPDRSTASRWDLRPAPAEQSQWSARLDGSTGLLPAVSRDEQPRRRAHPLLWTVALLMSGLCVASMSYTRLWPRLRDKILAWADVDLGSPRSSRDTDHLSDTPLVMASKTPRARESAGARRIALTRPGAERSLPGSRSRVGSIPRPLLASVPQAASRPAIASRAQAPSLEAGTGGPALEADTGALVIPIEGPATGLRQYLLSEPEGLAINLPQASPRIAFGDYRLSGGAFRLVWVRRRAAGGLHLRVFYSKGSTPSVRVSDGIVRVTVPRPGRTEEIHSSGHAAPRRSSPKRARLASPPRRSAV